MVVETQHVREKVDCKKDEDQLQASMLMFSMMRVYYTLSKCFLITTAGLSYHKQNTIAEADRLNHRVNAFQKQHTA